jgi:hypothetical protein
MARFRPTVLFVHFRESLSASGRLVLPSNSYRDSFESIEKSGGSRAETREYGPSCLGWSTMCGTERARLSPSRRCAELTEDGHERESSRSFQRA